MDEYYHRNVIWQNMIILLTDNDKEYKTSYMFKINVWIRILLEDKDWKPIWM